MFASIFRIFAFCPVRPQLIHFHLFFTSHAAQSREQTYQTGSVSARLAKIS